MEPSTVQHTMLCAEIKSLPSYDSVAEHVMGGKCRAASAHKPRDKHYDRRRNLAHIMQRRRFSNRLKSELYGKRALQWSTVRLVRRWPCRNKRKINPQIDLTGLFHVRKKKGDRGNEWDAMCF